MKRKRIKNGVDYYPVIEIIQCHVQLALTEIGLLRGEEEVLAGMGAGGCEREAGWPLVRHAHP